MSRLKDITIDLAGDDGYLPPRLVIGPKSYLADRITPELEFSVLPERAYKGAKAQIKAEKAIFHTEPFGHPVHHILGSARGHLTLSTEQYALDLRPLGLKNWSHTFNQAIPMALKISEELKAHGMERPIVVLNPKLSSKIYDVFDRLGFEMVVTRKSVRAPRVYLENILGNIVLQQGHRYLGPYLDDIAPMDPNDTEDFGTKIFLNRKDNRLIKNNETIVELLEQKGFRTIYAEEWSLQQQMRIVTQATEIVVVHGAALAPLMYRQVDNGPLRLVELFPVGHMVPFSLAMAKHLKCDYVAVRGQIERSMIPDLYGGKGTPLSFTEKYSTHSFIVDTDSLELALDTEKLDQMLKSVSRTWPFTQAQ